VSLATGGTCLGMGGYSCRLFGFVKADVTGKSIAIAGENKKMKV